MRGIQELHLKATVHCIVIPSYRVNLKTSKVNFFVDFRSILKVLNSFPI